MERIIEFNRRNRTPFFGISTNPESCQVSIIVESDTKLSSGVLVLDYHEFLRVRDAVQDAFAEIDYIINQNKDMKFVNPETMQTWGP